MNEHDERLVHDVWTLVKQLRMSPMAFGEGERMMIRQAAEWLTEVDAELSRLKRLKHLQSVYL